MATNITAHIVVDFDGAADEAPNVLVEIDSRPEGYNGGKTSFLPGDNAFLLLYVPIGWSCKATYVTAGSMALYASGIGIAKEDYYTFVDDEPVTLQYPYYGGFSYSWLGASQGVISQANNICSIPPRSFNATTGVYSPANRIGLAKIGYTSNAEVYRISSVPSTIPKVAALFVVSKN
jgi:hypothetical protein